jgi:hypothetical protein
MAAVLVLGASASVPAQAATYTEATVQSAPASSIQSAEIANHFKTAKPGKLTGGKGTTTYLFDPSGPENVEVQPDVENPTPLAECYANNGAKCSIKQDVTATWSVSSDIGVDFQALNASIGGSYQESVTQGIQCDSPALAWNQKFTAVARGTFVSFDWVTRIAGVETDRQRVTAFIPTGIGCKVAVYK